MQWNAEKHSKQFVVGGKIWAHFNVRCPSCNKLFRIESKEVLSKEPHFECRTCQTVFSFENPPKNINKIPCKIVERTKIDQVTEDKAIQNAANFKRCPKCQGLNPRLSKDCLHCHVVFSKLIKPDLTKDLKDPENPAIASLTKTWRDLLRDYQNVSKHLAFVDRCEDLQALPFALRKYQELQKIQPQDMVVKEMLYQVWLRGISDKFSKYKKCIKIIKTVNWMRVQKMGPWVVGLLMIAIGLFFGQSLRNLAGFGAAVLFLWLGLIIFKRGKIEISDFY